MILEREDAIDKNNPVEKVLDKVKKQMKKNK